MICIFNFRETENGDLFLIRNYFSIYLAIVKIMEIIKIGKNEKQFNRKIDLFLSLSLLDLSRLKRIKTY